MGHELTKNDIKKMEEEIEYRIHERYNLPERLHPVRSKPHLH